jgi:hypothetical protein
MTTRRILALTVAFIVLGVAGPQEDATLTAGFSNGRAWNVFTGEMKGAYLAGFMDSAMLASLLVTKDYKPCRDAIEGPQSAPGMTNGEIIRALDQFYRDVTNVRIPISFAYLWTIQKYKGEDAAVLEARLSALRAAYNK